MLARTYLFVPGNRPERFAKALAGSTDLSLCKRSARRSAPAH